MSSYPAAIALALLGLLTTTLHAASHRHVVLISVDGFAYDYFDDPKAHIPTIRKLAAQGVRVKRMECSYPTVTWTNHTTLVTGVHPAKHGVIGNDYFDRTELKKVPFIPDPIFNKDEIVLSPTIYDVAKEAGLSTAGIIWPATRGAKTLDWTVPDVFEQELFEKYSTPSLLADARELGIPVHMQMDWCKKINEGKPMRDYMYARLASHVITKHKPNLMMLHLVTVDSAQHSYGRNSPEAYWALNDSDNRVRDMVDAIESAGLTDKTTFFVTTDHGFYNFSKTINLNALLRSEGLLKSLGTKVSSAQAYAMSEGGACFVYILDQANREKIMADLKPKLLAVEGVASLTDNAADVGHKTAAQDPREPDLFLSAKDGYSFTDSLADAEVIKPTDGIKGAHGHFVTEDLLGAACVISGADIKQGVVIDAMKNIDIAPTMAKMLGIEMPNVDGRVLSEALK
jgi:predicted AlkP superfamily pyrophosphatase or phosphodiesterase